jgi:hypothetical protein
VSGRRLRRSVNVEDLNDFDVAFRTRRVLSSDTERETLLRFVLRAAIVKPGRLSFVGSFSGRQGLQVREVVMNRVLALALVVSMAGTSVFAAGAQAPANSSIAGSVKSSSGRVIGHATVRLRDLETGQLAGTATSDAAGQFSFPGLMAGTFTVEIVSAAGEILGSSAPISVAAGAAITGVVVTTADHSKKGGAFFTSTAGIIAVAASGAAVAGVTAATGSTASGSK